MKRLAVITLFCLGSLAVFCQGNGPAPGSFGGKPSITGGFIESGGVQLGNAGSGDRGIDNAILLGSTIAGVVDTIVLCVRPIAGSANVDVEGSLTWREVQ